jgi:hypothetical protein
VTESRICACGCGASLVGLRADALYQSEACKKRAQRAASRDKAGTGEHPLQEVRDQAALDKHTRDLNGLIRQAIIDTIKTRGSCHADDLIDLYPVGEVDRCRELATRQFASLRSGKRPLISERERRASSVPARKRSKSGVYVFTKHGRETLSGLSSEVFRGVVPAAESGENQEIVGVADGAGVLAPRDGLIGNSGDQGGAMAVESSSPSAAVDAGRVTGKNSQGDLSSPSSVAGIDSPATEPLQLDDARRRAPSMFDPYEGEAA